jgi:hypothetical protein
LTFCQPPTNVVTPDVHSTISDVVVDPLLTVTVADRVAELPAVSNARALTVCDPLTTPVLFHANVYGDDVSVAIRVPSTMNSTRFTATLSVAVADTFTVPLTVAPFAGDVRLTVGAVVSPLGALFTETVIVLDNPLFPAASKARARSV